MRTPVFFLCAVLASVAQAEDDVPAALSLVDAGTVTIEQPSNWRGLVEGASVHSTLRNGDAQDYRRLSLDVQYDGTLAQGLGVVFADRLDLNSTAPPTSSGSKRINTLKEAYLSWRAQTNTIVDIGRVNARYGVASGYNPNDYFRSGALRSIVSVDPLSLKRNRQGSIMLRGQVLWDSGSTTGIYSPKISEKPSDAPFNLNVGATNNQNRWLIALSQRLNEDLTPQLLLYKEEQVPAQLGLNLMALIDSSAVAYMEWSGGRSQSLLTKALAGANDSAFRNRLASGATYTMSTKLSITLEYEYNGAGLNEADWNALRVSSPVNYLQYRFALQAQQELPTKRSIFLYATWQDALASHFDVSAMIRHNMADHSRLYWIEGRYHFYRCDVTLQWQVNSGAATSEFGAIPQRRNVQAMLTYFF
jgi:hypothetical protein